jgi:hypothetical protein
MDSFINNFLIRSNSLVTFHTLLAKLLIPEKTMNHKKSNNTEFGVHLTKAAQTRSDCKKSVVMCQRLWRKINIKFPKEISFGDQD